MKIDTILIICFLSVNYLAKAQQNTRPTDSILIYGKIIQPIIISLDDINRLPSITITDQIIYNQNGQIKDTLTELLGVPLKSVLSSIQFVHQKAKELNAFYFIFRSSDNYKAVFSWNEIYNTEIGDYIFIITKIDKQHYNEIDKRIFLISTKDLKTGRRNIKGLDRIEIRYAE